MNIMKIPRVIRQFLPVRVKVAAGPYIYKTYALRKSTVRSVLKRCGEDANNYDVFVIDGGFSRADTSLDQMIGNWSRCWVLAMNKAYNM